MQHDPKLLTIQHLRTDMRKDKAGQFRVRVDHKVYPDITRQFHGVIPTLYEANRAKDILVSLLVSQMRGERLHQGVPA